MKITRKRSRRDTVHVCTRIFNDLLFSYYIPMQPTLTLAGSITRHHTTRHVWMLLLRVFYVYDDNYTLRPIWLPSVTEVTTTRAAHYTKLPLRNISSLNPCRVRRRSLYLIKNGFEGCTSQ